MAKKGSSSSSWCCCFSSKFRKDQKVQDEIDNENQGNPRNRVALLPGHSLMDWIRLGNSGKDLTSVGGQIRDVTEEELAEHKEQNNAWIAIRGRVYNVAPYMNFHPGGVPELMKGAGKDATDLFTEIHPWVNYESILQKCLVGRLVKCKTPATVNDLTKAFFEAPAPKPCEVDTGCRDESVFDSNIKMGWCQTSQKINFYFLCKVSSPHVLVMLKPENHLRILLRVKKKLHVFSFKLANNVIWPCHVSVNTDTGRVEIEFTKKEEGCWDNYGVNDKDHAIVAYSVDEIETYHKARIISINQVTHNVRTFVFKFIDKVYMWVPIGHDIRIRAIIEGIDYAKQYTPIPPFLPHCDQTIKHWHQDYICCMVKYYSDGALTPYLFSKKEKDVVEIGGMSGSFNIRKLNHVKELYLIAAGSGISPMLRILVWGISKKDQVKSMNLLSVNRYEEDIIWRNELDQLAEKEKTFKVTYCLSQPGPDWAGLSGRIDDKILDGFIPNGKAYDSELPEFYICACGPIQFLEMIREKLDKRGYGSCSHCFIG